MSDQRMNDQRKQNISLRMNGSDLKKIKAIANRLHVRESDVYRFAIKTMLAKLGPLHNANLKGTDILPVLLEIGPEFVSYFNLDAAGLEQIINSDISTEERKVQMEDIELLALSASHENFVMLKLKELSKNDLSHQGISYMLREYLVNKYVENKQAKSFDLENPETAPA